MDKVENGQYISVEYTGTLENGDVFDSSQGRKPLEIHMGAGEMIKGFEDQLMGMALNEKKKFTISPENAYGQKSDKLMQSIPRSEVPPDMELELGMIIGLQTQDGQRVPARIAQMDENQIVLDLNHPLAGESLTFEIEVVGISSTATQASSCCDSECDCSGSCCE